MAIEKILEKHAEEYKASESWTRRRIIDSTFYFINLVGRDETERKHYMTYFEKKIKNLESKNYLKPEFLART